MKVGIDRNNPDYVRSDSEERCRYRRSPVFGLLSRGVLVLHGIDVKKMHRKWSKWIRKERGKEEA